MEKIYDIVILGAGVAGSFAVYKLSRFKDIKYCLIDFGRPPGKRRKQLQGWMGCFPHSNARLYLNSCSMSYGLNKSIEEISGKRISKNVDRYVKSVFGEYGNLDGDLPKFPNNKILKRISDLGYECRTNSFSQWKPESIHSLSKHIASYIEDKGDFYYDDEIIDVDVDDGLFKIKCELGYIYAKNVLLAVGRSGWRFSKKIFEKFNLVNDNNYGFFGFKGEISAKSMPDWNKSHCTIYNDSVIIGPLSWNGTVIPEDHYDLVISAWRSNEDRWKSDRVAFSVIMKAKFENKGMEQTERLGKLAYVLADNRIGKGKVKEYLKGFFDLSLVPEYNWFDAKMKEIDRIIPGFMKRGYFYVPDITPTIPRININKNFSTKLDGLYVAGESAGVFGILGAAITGCIVADSLIK